MGNKPTGLPVGRPPKHGGYSLRRDVLLKERPEVVAYVESLRRDLIQDLEPRGEKHLSAAKRCLVDRFASKLGVLRLIECFLAESGVFRKDGSPEPVLTFWVSLNSQLREDLRTLGLERAAKAVGGIDISKLVKKSR